MSRELARIPMDKLQKYIVEMESFSGNAQTADKITSADPYSVVWDK
ncbi:MULTISPECIES: hypothetical protein [Desulfonatronospira]|nr:MULTISPECIES: hypothetical protein [Desulfonatronospira]